MYLEIGSVVYAYLVDVEEAKCFPLKPVSFGFLDGYRAHTEVRAMINPFFELLLVNKRETWTPWADVERCDGPPTPLI